MELKSCIAFGCHFQPRALNSTGRVSLLVSGAVCRWYRRNPASLQSEGLILFEGLWGRGAGCQRT